MKIIPAKTPGIVKTLLPNFIWNVNTEDKTLYLTFDDGPTPKITHWVLDVLKQYNAKATFFCIGKNIEKHPNIFEDIVNQGHSIGNHTYNHVKGWKTSVDTYLEEVKKTQDVINTHKHKSKSINQKLFRPPYGQVTPWQIKKLQEVNYKIVMWNVLSVDWNKKISGETCLNNVTNNATSGSIIVFHDSVKASKNMQYVLPKALEFFKENGYAFKRIPE